MGIYLPEVFIRTERSWGGKIRRQIASNMYRGNKVNKEFIIKLLAGFLSHFNWVFVLLVDLLFILLPNLFLLFLH